ncbi:MAG: hypothetical protein IJL30_00295 [Clostridia bacterium]|nr:hypothetical protein [Clostridia bacterium]
MTEEILYVLTQMKNGILNEYEAASIIEAMISPEEGKKALPAVINGVLPWDDDGKIRITVFNGHTLVDSQEAYEKYEMTVDLGNADIEIAECCGDIKCEDIGGNAVCGRDIICEDVFGDVKCGGNIECESIIGDVTCGGDIVYGNGEEE